MSDGPEFEEVKITAADVRRRSYASALLLGAVLPGMAEIEVEARENGPRPEAVVAAGVGVARPAPELRLFADGGAVIGTAGELARFAALFSATRIRA